ncbi:MAG: double-cubane-cluster-containing anaerobic reductase [Peptoniphilus sp.]|nr:double-cubane-cluster-containing anaerobic reductase [Peptoniphilus sp.]MDD7363003.1 double-cubane-cluster-containing anaerobic reductase [Bacillota bacterium]MDY6045268.1 double-cubane-cluster-containing anaerobic reductase [Peptoniphilus sp.]
MDTIIKDLPEIFDDFADARKQGFMAVKKIKDQDIPVVGAYCTYFPQEIANALGAASIGLCSTSEEPIADAEKDLPKNLCPLIKSSYGFGKTDKCPYFHFSDVVIGETTCDGKKKMYEMMQDFKDIHVMELPNSQSDDAKELWKKEVYKTIDYLEKKFDAELTYDSLKDAIETHNEIRRARQELGEVMENDPTPVDGLELHKVFNGTTYKFDKKAIPGELDALRDKIMEEYDPSTREKKPRILITGCPSGGAPEKVIKALEENGAVVVSYENCTGEKQSQYFVDDSGETLDELIDALSERYLNIGCSVMTPNPNRYELLGYLIDKYHVDGVVEIVLTACHTYNIESSSIQKYCNEEKNIPYLAVETDYSQADVGQLNTRLTAFVEML